MNNEKIYSQQEFLFESQKYINELNVKISEYQLSLKSEHNIKVRYKSQSYDRHEIFIQESNNPESKARLGSIYVMGGNSVPPLDKERMEKLLNVQEQQKETVLHDSFKICFQAIELKQELIKTSENKIQPNSRKMKI